MLEDSNINFPIESLKEFFCYVDQGILFFDDNLRFLYANDRAGFLLGAESQEKAGRVIKENCPEDAILKSKNGNANTTFIEIKGSSNRESKLLGVEFIFQNPDGFYPVYVVLLHDFSNWEKLDRMRTDFISSVSHRLRTPITSVRNSLELLNMNHKEISAKESRKLLEIGVRNIIRLSSSLDELQKIFMVESEEMNAIRSLIRIGEGTTDILKRLDSDGLISGFELTSCNIAVFTARSKLEDYLVTVAGLFRNWIGVNPFVSVEVTQSKFETPDEKTERLEISLEPEIESTRGINLKDFLYYQEAHRSLILEKLAGVLNGTMSVNENKITIIIPINPDFDREKDLVHPLHVMLEQTRIEKKKFRLVNLKICKNIQDVKGKNELLKRILSDVKGIEKDCFIVMDEEPFSYLIFFIDRSKKEIEKMIKIVIDQFAESCGISTQEGRSAVSWDIKFQNCLELDNDNDPKFLNAKELI